MARQTGSQRRANQSATREARNSGTKTKRVTKDGKVFTVTSTDGGKTWTNPQPYTGPSGPFAMVKNPFKKSEKKDSKKSNLKIKGAGPTKGAAAAQEMARKRIAEGRNTVTGELKKPKKSNGSSTTKRGTGQGNRSLNRNATTTTPKKRKRIKSELWD